jgi:8-oxo-dGTP pyrophosphatase MutT (NUDIX family)
MQFHNKANPVHIVFKSKFVNAIIKFFSKLFKKSTRLVWESRSVAANLVVLMKPYKDKETYVLVSKRGPKAADYRGLFNVVAGYLDWNESGAEAAMRECWEETGLDLASLVKTQKILKDHLTQPWYVKTDPSENRQNISLRYGISIQSGSVTLPALSIENNEVIGEVEDPQWMPVSQIDNHKWAFNHDQVIKDYLKLTNK